MRKREQTKTTKAFYWHTETGQILVIERRADGTILGSCPAAEPLRDAGSYECKPDNTYARTFAEAEQKAVAFLPNFGDFVLSTCLDKVCIEQEILRDNQRHENGQDTRKTAFLAVHQIPPRGVEPLLPG